MSSRRRILVISAVLLLAATAGVAVLRGRAAPSPATADRGGEAEVPSMTFTFPAGSERVYRLAWARDDWTVLPTGPQEGSEATFSAELGAELTLRSFGRQADVTIVGLSLASITTHRVEVLGQSALVDARAAATALGNQTAYLEITDRGEIRAVRFPEGGTQDLFRHLVTALLAELDVRLPSGRSRWTASGPGSFGSAELEFAWNASAGARLERRRVHYTGWPEEQLTSSADIRLDPTGLIRDLRASEQVELAGADAPPRSGRVSTRLTYVRDGRFAPPSAAALAALLATTDARAVGEVRPGQTAERQLLEERAGGMTAEQLFRDLDTLASVGSLTNPEKWMWQATGLLRLHPELAGRFVPLFERADFGASARSFALDTLALAGTAEAQTALTDVMELPAIRGDAALRMDYVQRLAVVAEPTADTVAFVEAQYAGAGLPRDAAAYTLGSLAMRLEAAGQPDEARRVADRLGASLDAATTTADKVTHLHAVGNTARADQVDRITRHADDASADVRMASARALSRTHVPAAKRTLLGLATDAATHVSGVALSSLEGHELDAGDLDTVLRGMQSGAIHRTHDPTIVAIVSRHLATPVARAILELVVARNPDDQALRSRARAMLNQS